MVSLLGGIHVEEGGLAIIAMTKLAVRSLPLVGLLTLASCSISEGPPLPEASTEVEVELQPGTNETYEFEIEVEATGFGRVGFDVIVEDPPSGVLRSWGAHEQWWVEDGVEHVGWPDTVIVEDDELLIGELYLNLSNETNSRIEYKMMVTIMASPLRVPGPRDETIRLAIRQR